MSASRPLRLRCFPSSDLAFRNEVESAMLLLADRMDAEEGADDERRAMLSDHLRPTYRSIDVVAQNALAQFTLDPADVWYVFRDGRIRMGDDGLERLYAALSAARKTVDASRVAMADAVAVAKTAGFTPAGSDAVGALAPVEALRRSVDAADAQ